MNIDRLKEGIALIGRAKAALDGASVHSELERLVDAYEYAIKNFAPFQVGDFVVLTSPVRNPGGGWAPYKHLFVVGATAVVAEVSLDKGGFKCLVEFVDDTSTPKPHFGFRAGSFVKHPDNEFLQRTPKPAEASK